MNNLKTKILLSILVLSVLPFSASALSFTNLSFGGTGALNSGNGYFNDDASQFLYTGSRNVYTITEDTQINILEPINYANGVSGAVTVINSSFGTLKDSVVVNGYLYFVDGTTLKKKSTRSNTGTCESNDTALGGCIITIATGVGETLRVYDNVLYFTVGTTGFKHLDDTDNVVDNFAICAPYSLNAQRRGFTVTKNNSILQVYVICGISPITVRYFTSTGSVTILPNSLGNANEVDSSFYTTSNYVYILAYSAGGSSVEDLVRISNSSISSVDYVTTNNLAQSNRVYVSGFTTIGLMVQSTSSYQTFNSNEAGISSNPLSEGSGIVEYVNKEISVPNPTYYNDSTIPFDINLKFIISQENLTNYQSTMQWHAIAYNPSGLQVSDSNIAITCNQQLPWWDVGGIFDVLLNLLGNAPWACDGTQTIQMTPSVGQLWDNGTWTVRLTEQIPGTTSVLSSDTWVIINQSTPAIGIINPPAPCPTCGLGTGGTINTNTSLQIIQVFSMVAFWGFIIWLGIVGTVIKVMASSPSGVNGMAVIVVAWLSAIFIALVGLFDPFKIYIIVLSTIIAAVLFRFGKNATTTEE